MPEQIRDGKGQGYLLEISQKNRAQTNAVVQSDDAEISEQHGLAFTVTTGPLILPDTNPHKILYLKNLDTNRNMYIWVVIMSWNGGNINYNRALYWSWHLATIAVPTDGAGIIPAGNLNFTSAQTAEVVTYGWDGTHSGGMEVATIAEGGGEYLTQGRSVIELHGTAIFGLNDAAVLSVTAEEPGKFSASTRIYFKDIVTMIP